MFVTIEGGDASGKGTQTKLLAEALRTEGIPCESWSFPVYQSRLGTRIQEALRDPAIQRRLNTETWMAMFAANRFEHRDRLQHDLDRIYATGGVLVSDRYVDSSIAHLGEFTSLSSVDIAHDVYWLEYEFYDMPRPDLIIFLEVSLDTALKRLQKRQRPTEAFDNPEKLKKAREIYRHLVQPPLGVRIDGEGTEAEVHERVKAAVLARLADALDYQGNPPLAL